MIYATEEATSEFPSGVLASFLSLKLRTDYSVLQQVREELSGRMGDKAGSVLHGRMEKLSLVSLAKERPRRDTVFFITQRRKE